MFSQTPAQCNSVLRSGYAAGIVPAIPGVGSGDSSGNDFGTPSAGSDRAIVSNGVRRRLNGWGETYRKLPSFTEIEFFHSHVPIRTKIANKIIGISHLFI